MLVRHTFMPLLLSALLAALLAALLIPAHALAAPATDSNAKPPTEAQCQRDLSKFEQAIAFSRQAQGAEAAARLRERLLPAQLESEVLARDGVCGLAKHLRDKRLLD